MTCIVGIVQNGKVYMGADSAGVSGDHISERADPKIFNNNGFIIGFTSSFRMGQILRYGFAATAPSSKEHDLFGFMVKSFVPEVREALKAGGYSKVESNVETGGSFLVAWRDRLFEIDDDFQVAEHACGYTAIGSGHAYALGAMHALPLATPDERIKAALSAAEKFCTSVCGIFWTASTH